MCRGVESVQVLIEGKPIGELWGSDYKRAFEHRVINPEISKSKIKNRVAQKNLCHPVSFYMVRKRSYHA
jgi:hypothetical protein